MSALATRPLEYAIRFLPRIYTEAEKGHVHRAATKVFGVGKYELLKNGDVRAEGLDYRYSFDTGRFYGVYQ